LTSKLGSVLYASCFGATATLATKQKDFLKVWTNAIYIYLLLEDFL